jgi:surfactin synthase thioesterase subunit
MINTIQLICFPFAGAGPSFFYAWNKHRQPGVKICPVQIAGRERLINEAPFTRIQDAADALAPQVLEFASKGPVALFGHCFLGSILAYEAALRLLDRMPSALKHVFLSAARTPEARVPQVDTAALDDDNFVRFIETTTNYSHPALADPDLRDILLPSLRADFLMDETYVPSEIRALPCPITVAIAGADTFVSRGQVLGWKSYTARKFDVMEFDGPHMYLVEQSKELLGRIAESLMAADTFPASTSDY